MFKSPKNISKISEKEVQMALTVQSIFNLVKNKYKLSLIAGKEGLSKSISWIYYTEDSSTIEWIRGGELAITLGVNFERQIENKGEKSKNLTEFLSAFIEKFVDYNASALIINTGKYIQNIPEEIISLCNKLNFPLFTMPWEIHTIDIMEEVGNLIATERQNSATSESFFYNAIFSPKTLDKNKILDTTFFDAKEFSIVLVEIKMNKFNGDNEAIKRYVNFSFNQKLNLPQNSFVSIIHNQKIIYVLKENFLQTAKLIARTAANDKFFYESRASISDFSSSLEDLPSLYEHALYALELNDGVNILNEYNNLGIYKILVDVKNKKTLEQMYQKTLGKLEVLSPDKLKDYLKTLELYLKFGGNIQKISEENSNHRNTVIYRISKIEEILGLDLSKGENRLLVHLCLYIKKLLPALKS